MKTKIIIAGIGAVGGYFGGLLSRHFYNNVSVEIDFFCRGENLKEIQNNGLKVIKGETEFIARPHLASDNATDFGMADYIIVATKGFDLETVIRQLNPCINKSTIILPLLNGVDSRERIKSLLPENLVLDGCVYLVSRLKQAGVIENTGNVQTIYFGLDNYSDDRLRLLGKLMKEAGIEATLSKKISTTLWEKYIFISPTATATSYFDKSIGEIVANEECLNTIKLLIEEVKQIAKAKQIIVSEDITEKTLNKLKGFPFKATSSLHSDFQNNKSVNELNSLTGYVVNEGRKYNLETPTYLKLYTELQKIITKLH